MLLVPGLGPGVIVEFRKEASTAVIIPAGSAEAILKKSRGIMEKMDRVKESLVNEDPQTVLSQGSSEI